MSEAPLYRTDLTIYSPSTGHSLVLRYLLPHRGISLIRNRPPLWDRHRSLGIVVLKDSTVQRMLVFCGGQLSALDRKPVSPATVRCSLLERKRRPFRYRAVWNTTRQSPRPNIGPGFSMSKVKIKQINVSRSLLALLRLISTRPPWIHLYREQAIFHPVSYSS